LDIAVIDSNKAKNYFVIKVGATGTKEFGIDGIRRINDAEFVEGSSDIVRTPFGATSVENLSTGCQTVLNLLHIKINNLSIGVDVTGCGANALEMSI
jgi:hypothetical protein